jgi:hypothetical protein
MMKLRRIALVLLITCCAAGLQAQQFTAGSKDIQVTAAGRSYTFAPSFVVLYNATDPAMALKPAGIKKVSYNVLTWKAADSSKAEFKQKKINESVAGDGFDDRILRGKTDLRTANVYNSGSSTSITATGLLVKGDTTFLQFPASPQFVLKAYVLTAAKPYPVLRYNFTPLQKGYYSIGYTGAPSFTKEQSAESWQPLIWTEKRTPEEPYLTPAFMATLPTTMVNDGVNTIGVLASPEYLPFQPLPVLDNSRFGVALLNNKRLLQPQLFAPIQGGYLSQMNAGTPFSFAFQLVVEPLQLSYAYEAVAEKVFGFKDYRHNDIASLNTALDNIVDYSLTHYAWFIDSLKGCAYSTDVPGAVKNVSSLNPLELAIVRDDSVMFEKRAYPLMEFMLSREKFLFSLDSMQKIQSPSRKLKGPIAPLSELGALYNVFGKENSFYTQMAEKEFHVTRVRNLDVQEKGNNWINAMFLYKATNDKKYLETAVKLARKYLQQRVYTKQTAFNDPLNGSHFFWPTFTNRWTEFLELYEITKDTAFLHAAQDGARHYTMFTWMVPAIPDSLITVNKGGKAPMYWYLKSKGHQQMYYPEEQAPAWRLSEIGLTPESSGTSTGHRAIMMANYAPWMLRVGYYANDTFLVNVAKAAIVGRYRSFPGYHINTERTTAYEKFDFPLHEHKEQSVNSFHYNHILPMASMLLDYLVTDAFVRSKGAIDFPDDYMEGYAYLQNKMYGAEKGNFYSEKAVQLWMPSKLLRIGNVELNYIAARKDNKLLLAFTNQSAKPVTTLVTVNPMQAKLSAQTSIRSFTAAGKNIPVKDSTFTVTVPANGITAVAVEGVQMNSTFQQRILSTTNDTSSDFATISEGNAKAMLFKMGEYARRLYVYLEDDDNTWKQAQLVYTDAKGKEQVVTKAEYPFEFTVPADLKKSIRFSLRLTGVDGKVVTSKTIELGK